MERLQKDIPFRIKYLFVHETEDKPTHICWRKVPPKCLSVGTGLANAQRLMVNEIKQLQTIIEHFDTDHYYFMLHHLVFEDSTLKIRYNIY